MVLDAESVETNCDRRGSQNGAVGSIDSCTPATPGISSMLKSFCTAVVSYKALTTRVQLNPWRHADDSSLRIHPKGDHITTVDSVLSIKYGSLILKDIN